MTSEQSHLFKLTTLIFNAAIGKEYYELLSPAVGASGVDVLARNWGDSELVETVLGGTPLEQARNLASNLGLDPDNTDPESGDAIAYNYFLSVLEGGGNVGTLAMSAIRYLEQETILESLVETKSYLENRADAAFQYSVGLGLGGTDLAALQAVISDVDSDGASVSELIGSQTANSFDLIRAKSQLTEFTDDDDEIVGTDGSDYLSGGSGFDTIDGGEGADIILGGSGDDELYGGRGQDMIEGGDGADILEAGTYYESNYVSGGYNADGEYVRAYYEYTADAYFEVLNGGSGADTIYGGYGSDIIDGGEGADYIVADKSVYYVDEVESVAGFTMFNDTVRGGEGDDRIYTHYGDDRVYGDDGDDRIEAGYGSDTVYGGSGDDVILLNNSTYSINANDGKDVAYGEAGDDTIYGAGSDDIDGGAGDDWIYYDRTAEGSDFGVITAGEGADQIRITSDDYQRSTSHLTVDLSEEVQFQDEITLSVPDRVASAVEVIGFDLDNDLLDLDSVSIYYDESASSDWSTVYQMQNFNYKGDLSGNYVQIVSSETTPWVLKGEGEGPDSYGKGYFVIQGAQADSDSASAVAELIDNYGGDAAYRDSAEHYFLVNVGNEDMGVYKFTDDTGANNRVLSDEITPVAVLVGVRTEDINYQNSDFIV